MLKLKQPFSQGGPTSENPTMTRSTTTARRKGDPHYMLRKNEEKNINAKKAVRKTTKTDMNQYNWIIDIVEILNAFKIQIKVRCC